MNDFFKGMILLGIILYAISPIDVCPGPIDDVIVILMGVAARKKLTAIEG